MTVCMVSNGTQKIGLERVVLLEETPVTLVLPAMCKIQSIFTPRRDWNIMVKLRQYHNPILTLALEAESHSITYGGLKMLVAQMITNTWQSSCLCLSFLSTTKPARYLP